MSRLIPIELGEMYLVDTEGYESLDRVTRDKWYELCELATFKWRRAPWEPCKLNERNIPMAIFPRAQRAEIERALRSPGRQADRVFRQRIVGVWALYRVRPIARDTNVVSALPAPMFPEIRAARLPGSDPDADLEAELERFWRSTFRTMEWMLDNPMPQEDGSALVLDHWRFPDRTDTDPAQHEWTGVGQYFTRYARKRVDFDGARATRMVRANKTNA